MPYEIANLIKPDPVLANWIAAMEAVTPVMRRKVMTRMRIAKKLQLPRLIYRFQSLRRTVNRKPDKPVFMLDSLERLRVPIVYSLLALRSPTEFNDPFDMSARLKIGGTEQQKRTRYEGMFDQVFPKGALADREAFVAERLNTPDVNLLPRIQQSHRDAIKDFGVTCFVGADKADPAKSTQDTAQQDTTQKDTPAREYPARDVLMWSHYAAEHSGVCLQFDPALDVRVFTHAVTVDYCDHYPVIDWIVDFREGIGRAILRKHSRWKYENEHRISIPDAAGKYLRFRPEALRGIILGCRADADVEAALLQLLAERTAAHLPRIKLYRAIQNDSRYALDIIKVSKQV